MRGRDLIGRRRVVVDLLWLTTASWVMAGAVLLAGAVLRDVRRGEVASLLMAPLWALAAWWLGMGAWRRTSWGRPTESRADDVGPDSGHAPVP